MNIYLLRHERRMDDTTFFSPLTSYGLKRADDLAEIIKTLDIDVVLSSPYIRTL